MGSALNSEFYNILAPLVGKLHTIRYFRHFGLKFLAQNMAFKPQIAQKALKTGGYAYNILL